MIAIFATCLVALLLFLLPLTIFLYKLWWYPLHIGHLMESQGIKGPSYKFLHGTTKEAEQLAKQMSSAPMELSHDIFPRVLPHTYSWLAVYGKNFLHWIGTQPQVIITEPELIKEILINKEDAFKQKIFTGFVRKLFGEGTLVSNGEKWTRLRKLSNHAFHGESLKDMIPSMIKPIERIVESWRDYEGKELDVCHEFQLLTSEVISRTAFGSSYLEGKKIFDLLTQLMTIAARNAFKMRISGIEKIIRTPDDIEADRIEQLLHDSVMEILKKRQDDKANGVEDGFGNDFLGSLLRAHLDRNPKKHISADEIVAECKTFYIAGQETTFSLLSWSMLLLSIHTDWQEKARNEVLELFGLGTPTSEGLSRLKIITMIIYETLRLYSPVSDIVRRTSSKVKLGKYEFPANISIAIPPLALHRDPNIWGKDAHLFNPERFAEGQTKAKNGNVAAFLGFGFGPRMCVGMNFSNTEAKIALSMILQRYKFTLSERYIHSPVVLITAQPQHGVQIMLQKL